MLTGLGWGWGRGVEGCNEQHGFVGVIRGLRPTCSVTRNGESAWNMNSKPGLCWGWYVES